MPKIHATRAPSYPIGVLPGSAEVEEPSAEEAGPPPSTPPAASARIGLWSTYGDSLGIDTAGLTKAQIKKAVA